MRSDLLDDATTPGQVDDPVSWKLLLGNVYFALLWLPLRFFVGREWLSAGEHKVRDDAWGTGASLQGYWERAVAVPEEGRPAITYGWYRDLLQYMLDHEWYTWFADVIAWGEVLVGIGLLVGALVGIAAFFGTVMNFNFQLAGCASTNPVLFGLERLPDPGLEGRRLLGTRSLAAAVARHPLEPRPDLRDARLGAPPTRVWRRHSGATNRGRRTAQETVRTASASGRGSVLFRLARNFNTTTKTLLRERSRAIDASIAWNRASGTPRQHHRRPRAPG